MSTPAPLNFAGDWITADHPEYDAAISRCAVNAQRRAKVVAFVRSPEDVARLLKYAKQTCLPIAICSGGHSTAGASSSDGGIVVDLSRYLNSVRVDPARKMAYVGGGAVWGTLDKAAIEHGLASVAGTVNHTGVGGLTLGGGYGWLTGEHGLVLDNVEQVTIVTADETIRTANATENSDLFWAVRGGGSNFGVVTEFMYRLHPQRRKVFAGFAFFPTDKLTEVVEALTEYWGAGPLPKGSIVHFVMVDPEGKPATALVFFWNGSEEEGRAHFKKFFDIGPIVDMCREMPYEELNTLQNDLIPHGGNYYMKGVFTSGPQKGVAEHVLEQIDALSTHNGIRLMAVFEYLPTGKVLSVPNDATAHIRGQRVSTLVFSAWPHGVGDKLPVVRSSTSALVDIILRNETKISPAENTGYGNYLADIPAPNDPTATYPAAADRLFGANYPRLQQLKKKYDPTLLFSKWWSILPAA